MTPGGMLPVYIFFDIQNSHLTAKPIMFFTFLACINEGDEVIYPNPGFPIYESMINFVGGVPVPLPLYERYLSADQAIIS